MHQLEKRLLSTLAKPTLGKIWAVDFGQTDFGQFQCFTVLTDFGQTVFSQFYCFCVLVEFSEPQRPKHQRPKHKTLFKVWRCCGSGCCGCWFGLPWTTFRMTLPSAGHPSAGTPKISLLFFSPTPIFALFVSLGVFSLNFGGVFENLQCARLDFSGCFVKPSRPRSRIQHHKKTASTNNNPLVPSQANLDELLRTHTTKPRVPESGNDSQKKPR